MRVRVEIPVRLSEFEWGKIVCLLESEGYEEMANNISEQLDDYDAMMEDDQDEPS